MCKVALSLLGNTCTKFLKNIMLTYYLLNILEKSFILLTILLIRFAIL